MKEPNQNPAPVPNWLELVQKHVAAIKFGSVHLVIHESQVIQIEATEKVRFDKPNQKAQ